MSRRNRNKRAAANTATVPNKSMPTTNDILLPDAVLVPAESNRPSKEITVEEALRGRKPLTAAEIVALPYKDRPPRSEWPADDVKKNPRPYKKRKSAEGRTYGSSIGHIDFVGIFGFLILWAVCAGIEYYIMMSMGLLQATAIALGIIFGLLTAGFIVLTFKGGGFGGSDVGTWF